MPRKAEHVQERGMKTIPWLLGEDEPHLPSLSHLISSGHPSPFFPEIWSLSVHHQKQDLLIPT